MPDVTRPPPGSTAQRPSKIPARGFGQVAARIVHRITETQLSLIAAGVAFFGLLALFPTLSAIVALGGLVLDRATVASQIEALLASLPQAAGDLLRGQIDDLISGNGDTLGLTLALSIAFALFSARRGTLNLMTGINAAYAEKETRGIVALQATSLALTLGVVVGIVGIVFIAAILPSLVSVVAGDATGRAIAEVLRWPLLLGIAIGGFSVIYRFAPSRRAAKWRWITPGASIGVAIWLAATVGFAWYAQTFGTYNETFGALAGVIVLMLWLYLSSFSILLGALVDAELEAQTARDSTVGADRPLGERGAVKADRCEGV